MSRRLLTPLLILLLAGAALPGCQQMATTETRGPVSCFDCEADCWPLPRLGPYCPELCDQTVPPDVCETCDRSPCACP